MARVEGAGDEPEGSAWPPPARLGPLPAPSPCESWYGPEPTRSRRRILTGLALLALFVSVEVLAPLPQLHHDCNELGDLFAAAATAAGVASSGHPMARAQLLGSDSPFDCPACMLLGMALVGSGPIPGAGLPAISSRTVSRPVQTHHVSIPHPFDGRAPPAA